MPQHTDRSSVLPSVRETSGCNSALFWRQGILFLVFSVDNVRKTMLECMCQRRSASSPLKARGKDLHHILFYTHRHGLGKRVTAWDCITLPTELPPEKKSISQWRIKGTWTPGKLSRPYFLEGKISQEDRATLKTPENTEGCHFTSRDVCQTLKPKISISTYTSPQSRSEGNSCTACLRLFA